MQKPVTPDIFHTKFNCGENISAADTVGNYICSSIKPVEIVTVHFLKEI
jgi:hypothetical protein